MSDQGNDQSRQPAQQLPEINLVPGPQKDLIRQINMANAREHEDTSSTIKSLLYAELTVLGHQPDQDLRIVDCKAVMLVVLPSTNHLNIRFGPTSANVAYNGPKDQLNIQDVAAKISAYLKCSTDG